MHFGPLQDIQVLWKPLRWFGSNLVHLVIPKSLETIFEGHYFEGKFSLLARTSSLWDECCHQKMCSLLKKTPFPMLLDLHHSAPSYLTWLWIPWAFDHWEVQLWHPHLAAQVESLLNSIAWLGVHPIKGGWCVAKRCLKKKHHQHPDGKSAGDLVGMVKVTPNQRLLVNTPTRESKGHWVSQTSSKRRKRAPDRTGAQCSWHFLLLQYEEKNN